MEESLVFMYVGVDRIVCDRNLRPLVIKSGLLVRKIRDNMWDKINKKRWYTVYPEENLDIDVGAYSDFEQFLEYVRI